MNYTTDKDHTLLRRIHSCIISIYRDKIMSKNSLYYRRKILTLELQIYELEKTISNKVYPSKVMEAYYDLGFLYLEKRKYKKAEEIFEEALKIEPNDPLNQFGFGISLFREGKGNIPRAIDYFTRVHCLKTY